LKRWNHIILTLCMAAAASACAGDRNADSTAPADPGAVGTAGTAKPAAARADRGDTNFVETMMADGTAEVALGKMAQQKASSKQVKTFAAMMVRDHTKAGQELQTVATHANVDMTKMDADMGDHKDLGERLSKLSGREFDREYIKAMVDDHEKAVKDTKDKAGDADNDHVKQWAAKALPVLEKHLSEAKRIQDTLK
jgi:putative membrane protein